MTDLEAIRRRCLDATQPGYGTRNRRAVLGEAADALAEAERRIATLEQPTLRARPGQ